MIGVPRYWVLQTSVREKFHLASVHLGHTVEEIAENTGWDLKPIPGFGETVRPSETEMAALHKIDKEGFWRS